ncbi:MAG: D-alanyl-D-alanine carboxypeptidase/D-alanyl-D-alanine-endopeptidase [Pedobacter sp.]|nr:MAG: D-alanyl-D-alanine carboxypeptidase/D-alanyl-D-alanine-endopeptidase [Pedobacter sp.]
MFKQTLLLFLILTALTSLAQPSIQRIDQAYNAFTSDPQTKYALTSLCILDANTGKIIYSRNENVGLSTASTLKTITSATAFQILGKDFRYQTKLAYSGTIETDGTLKGNLIIVGGGDPTLGSWRYETTTEGTILNMWVKAIKEAGIKKIDGNVIGDESIWGTQTTPDGWVWQDIGNYYGSGASGLSWRENQFDLHLRANRSDNSVSVLKVVPAMPHLKIVNELKAGPEGSGDNVYSYLPALSSIAYLRGTWGLGASKSGISAATPDPAFDAAYRLQDTLQRIGITSTLPATTSRILNIDKRNVPTVSHVLTTVNSPSLSQIVYWFNKKSVNLYGEHLIKTIAWKTGKTVSTKNGASAIINYWAAKGIDRNALNILDGSGLSPGTRVTTYAMASILFQVQKEPWFPDYYNSLPENNGMKIKSGTINDVSAFAGYYTNSTGGKYVIVINVNNYSGSGINKKLFRVLDALK